VLNQVHANLNFNISPGSSVPVGFVALHPGEDVPSPPRDAQSGFDLDFVVASLVL